MDHPMRILHLPSNIGGHPHGLAQAEKTLGHDSTVLTSHPGPFSYPADRTLSQKQERTTARKLVLKVKMLAEFLRARSKYDVFHFNAGSSFLHFLRFHLPLLDVPLYPKSAKLIFTYNGCDARQRLPTAADRPLSPCACSKCGGGTCTEYLDDMKRRAIAKMDRHAHAIFALNPDLLPFLPARARFLPYCLSSWHDLAPLPPRPPDGVLRLVHAPTDRHIKGTADIVRAVASLRREYGDRVRLTIVENRPNREALARYAEADLLLDQTRIGWYGGLAVEGMRLGRPVAVYLNPDDLRRIPPAMARDAAEAFIAVSRGTLAERLREFVEAPERLNAPRAAALDFVHRWHDPGKVAAQVVEAYEG